MKITEPIRCKEEINALVAYYRNRGNMRNFVLIVLCLYTALRSCDILRLTWDDVYDFKRGRIRKSISIQEKKTKKTKIIALNAEVKKALKLFLFAAEPGRFLIENRQTHKALSRCQAYRIVRAASEAIAMQKHCSCHSLRKTFGYHAYKSGTPLLLIMRIYNHSSIAVTERYLGITQDDIDAVYNAINYVRAAD